MKTGKLPENALKRSVLRQIRKKGKEVLNGAGVGADCAIFSPAGEKRAAVCMQEGVVIPGERALEGLGEIPLSMAALIQKCANNLAAGGARPAAVMITLLLPEGTEEPDIRALMAEAEEKCAELGMEIAGGQTRITGAVNAPAAVLTGYGLCFGENVRAAERAAPGQDVLVSKWIGLEGTALAARHSRAELLKRYPAYLVEEAAGFDRYLSVIPEAETAVRNGVCAMHDASEGGILGALWELAEGAKVGLSIDLRKLPLRQETVEVCECCGLNPYELLSGGCLIMTTWDGPKLLAALEQEKIPAALIGRVTEGNDRILTNGDEIRYMDRPKRDGIYACMGTEIPGHWDSRGQ